jgi:hypothetical protein
MKIQDEEIQVFYNGSFITYLTVPTDICEEDIVKLASEHLPREVTNLKVRFSPHRFLNLTKLEK